MTESREKVKNFLSSYGVGVLATASKSGQPHAATIYVTYDELANIYFITKENTQKNTNLKDNPRAAFVVSDNMSQTTLQIQGSVEEVSDPKNIERIFSEIWRVALKSSRTGTEPTTQLQAGGYVVYRLTPDQARLTSFSTDTMSSELVQL